MKRNSYLCCGVRIDGVGPETAVRMLLDSRYGVARGAHLCNSYTLALAFRSKPYRADLNSGHLNFADGHYVAMVGRWRRQRDLTTRVYGPDLMVATMDRGRECGLRHYLYGATPETVARLAEALKRRYPGVAIVGIEAPPFRGLRAEEEATLMARIAQARPDIVWVGTGTPRQDQFVACYTARLGCTVVPVGAAFDFHAGNKRPAPRFVKRTGFEWLFRLAMEPRRLWRRYLIGIPVFIVGVITDLGRRLPARPPVVHAAAPPAEVTLGPAEFPAQRGLGAAAVPDLVAPAVDPRLAGMGASPPRQTNGHGVTRTAVHHGLTESAPPAATAPRAPTSDAT